MFLLFLKTIVFQVMKAISYLLKSEHGLFYSSKNSQADESLSGKFHTTKKKLKWTVKDHCKNFN